MRKASFPLILLLAVAAVLSGCHGFFTPETGGNSGGNTGTPGRFAYVANNTGSTLGGTISAYTINSSNGALTQVAGSPFTASLQTDWITVDRAGTVVYASDQGGTLTAYLINRTDGTLQPVAGSPFSNVGDSPVSVVVTGNAQFVYVLNQLSGQVFGFSTGANGVLSAAVPNSPYNTNSVPGPTSIRIDPTGQFLYVCDRSSGIFVFTINASTGALTQVDNVKPNGSSQPYDIAFTPDGHFAFAANSLTTGGVDVYSVNGATGDLSLLSGSPVAEGGNTPVSVAVDPGGKFLYIANNRSNNVSVLQIASNGALTAVSGSPFATGTNPIFVAVDPSGSFAFVVNFTDNTVNVYGVGSSGSLTLNQTVSTGTNPKAIVVTK